MKGLLRAGANGLANGLWFALCLPDAVAFRAALRDIAGTQQKLLLSLLRRNAGTEYGRRYDFAAIRSAAEYQARVPLTTYDDYLDAVERIGAGERGVLTRDPVLLLERTSGSAAATKLVPYTAALRAEFQRAIAPWIVDLYGRHPRLFAGQAYWSVTPVTRRNERTAGGLPVGFEEDAEYFGRWQRHLIRAVQAVPALVRLIDDVDAFRYATLLFLLRSRSLTLISVWNPTFLSLLVERLPAWWPRLAADIASGTLSPPSPLAADLDAALRRLNRPDPARAAEICRAFEAAACSAGHLGTGPGAVHARLWPRLRLISCWMDAQAALYSPELSRLFPQAHFQAKGLLATEGVVSFPLAPGRGEPDSFGAPGPAGAALAIRSHFFEFLPVEDEPAGPAAAAGARPLLAHELEPGRCYSVVITTGGGLYRYRLEDVVQVRGFLRGCPLLRFVGREAHVSDHFGEKLNERHVRRALDTALRRHAVRPTFAMLACEGVDSRPGRPGDGGADGRGVHRAAAGPSADDRPVAGRPAGPACPFTTLRAGSERSRREPAEGSASAKPAAYTLFVEAPDQPDGVLLAMGQELEAALQENFHYRYCRGLGQLGPLRVFRVDGGGQAAYLAACRARGQRAGDVKPVALHRLGGWSRAFHGTLLPPR